MNRRQKIIVSVTGIFIVLLILLGLTYAYFLTRINGNTNNQSISVSTARLELTYDDGNGTFTANNIEPGYEYKHSDGSGKTFSVTNNGTKDTLYGVYLENVVNTFTRVGDLKYTLTCTKYNKVAYETAIENGTELPESIGSCLGATENDFPSTDDLMVKNTIGVNEVHFYDLKVRYYNFTNIDQSIDMNKTFSGKIQIYGGDTTMLNLEMSSIENGYYAVVHSDPVTKEFRVDANGNGTARFIGIPIGSHEIKVYNKNDVLQGTGEILIKQGESESINGNTLTITNNTKVIYLDVSNITDGIIDLQTEFSNYPKGSLAYKLIENAKSVTDEQELTLGLAKYREEPVKKVGEETSSKSQYKMMSFGGNTVVYMSSTVTPITTNYFTYGDNYSAYLEDNYATLTNKDGSPLKSVQYSTGYQELIGKYVISLDGLETSTPENGEYLGTIYYITDATDTSFTYKETAYANNTTYDESYIAYGDSYYFDTETGLFKLINSDGSPIQAGKYKDIYQDLTNKYIYDPIGYESEEEFKKYEIGRTEVYIVKEATLTSITRKRYWTNLTPTYVNAESTLSKNVDDYGETYYYRGGVQNNYVNFANMCWRVVRIEGNGGIKLILEDQDEICSSSMDGNFNIEYTNSNGEKYNKGYYGFSTKTFGENTLSIVDYINPTDNTDRTMQHAFKQFQNNKLSNYLTLLKAGDWCYDDTAYTRSYDENNNTIYEKINDVTPYYENGINFYYGSEKRIMSEKKATLKCEGKNLTKFNDNTSMYVSTLTGDEIVYAGASIAGTGQNTTYYLYKNDDLYWDSAYGWWTLSPSRNSIAILMHFGKQLLGNDSNYSSEMLFRPAISLKNGINYAGGDGTIDNPYTISAY